MNILLTNDDGYDRRGITLLAEALEEEHSVIIVAPDGNRSGYAHGFTLHDPVRFRSITNKIWACSGTPADCVSITSYGILDFKPDLIFSGINYGPNLGTDIVYSGTAAAAREGTLKGIPSVAVSLTKREPPYDFSEAVDFLLANLNRFIKLWDRDHFLNINIPPILNDPVTVHFTYPCIRKYNDNYQSFTDPHGDLFTFMDGDIDVSHPEEGSDLEAVEGGFISLSPVGVHPVNSDAALENYLREWHKE